MKKIQLLIILLCLCNINIIAQNMKIMTYNVENLFDTQHDEGKDDYEYLPSSKKKWTNTRYYHKIRDVMKTITNIGGWEPPMLVGLCEIENDNVLNDMTQYPPYSNLNYKYVHFEGPDNRGIDVALLYNTNLFTPIHSEPIHVMLDDGSYSRDILYVKGTDYLGDTLHVFQVHFPSRREGEFATISNRVTAATILKEQVDNILLENPASGIIIMGDFNDNPSDFSPATILGAKPFNQQKYENGSLYNLCWDGYMYEDKDEGTYFHKGVWDCLDQIIVSGALMNGNLKIKFGKHAKIFNPTWLGKWNKKMNFNVPKRTYAGPTYIGGTSDHYPIYIDFNETIIVEE